MEADSITGQAPQTPDGGHRPVDLESEMRGPDQDEKQQATKEREVEGSGEGMVDGESVVYLQGKRFWLVTTSLAVMVFMVNLEIPVVVTALVAITNDLSGFNDLSWVISSYLLGYVAVIVIFAKLSDIFGRKTIYMLSMAIFIAFSAACSASQTMVQLIAFRAFQGVGGGGCFSLSTIIITELVPQSQYTKFVSRLTIVTSCALLLGPIVGGAISSHTTWRWIFIINCPIAGTALFFTLVGMPRNFPYQGQPNRALPGSRQVRAKSTLDRVDLPGTALLLFAVLSLTAAFEEADSEFPWDSAYVITLLVLSVALWIMLLIWERRVTRIEGIREPILPWRFFTNRVMMGVLLGFVLLGGPVVASIFQLPQRYQLIYGLSGLDAGVRLIPFTLASPVGTAIAASITMRFKVPPIYTILLGSCLQVIGFALLGTLPLSLDIPHQMYGYEIIAGFGVGMNFTFLFLIIPQTAEPRDQAVAMGAASQFRMMGSAIVVAISTSVFNSYVRPQLASLLGLSVSGMDSLQSLSQYLGLLPVEVQENLRLTLAEGYNRQMLVLCVSAAAQIPAAFLMWKKEQITV